LNTVDFMLGSMKHVRAQTLRTVQGMTLDDLRWRPGPSSNSAGALLIHIGAAQDSWFNRVILGGSRLWEAEKWYERFHMDPKDFAWGFDRLEAGNAPTLDQILEFLARCQESSIAVIKGLTVEKLGDHPASRPDVRLVDIIRHVVAHESLHQGQIDYLKGWRERLKAEGKGAA